MIAFVQPFDLSAEGGGARILRSLLAGSPSPYVSVCTAPAPSGELDAGREVHLPLRPHFGTLERTRVLRYLGLSYLDVLLGARFSRRLEALCRERKVSALHAIPHGLEFWYAYQVSQRLGLPYFLNVHDDPTYNLRDRVYLDQVMERLAEVWVGATGRIVISQALGEEYTRRYGRKPYTVITDGLTDVAPGPVQHGGSHFHVYFMGSVHLSYKENFASFLLALDTLQKRCPERQVSLSIRGGIPFDLPRVAVPVKVLPWASQEEIDRDLQEADVLYFPLPFEPQYESFVRFSLSTKLVTYLGSGTPILYHGPAYAAAGQLLSGHRASLMACDPSQDTVLMALQQSTIDGVAVTNNALSLAREQFLLEQQQRKFWEMLSPPHVMPQLECID